MKTTTQFVLASLLVLSPLVNGVASGTAHAESETVKGAQKYFQSFKNEMSAKLSQLDQEIDQLKTKAKENSTKTQEKAIHDLEETRTQLQKQLDTQMADAQETTTKSWKQFKDSFAKSVDHLNSKIQKALKD